MSKQFPPEFRSILKESGIKKAWISDVAPVSLTACENCGGVGSFYLFVATKGPFESPPAAYSKVVTHSDIIGGRIVWWSGKSYSYPCPVCGKGLVQGQLPEPDIQVVPPPAHLPKEIQAVLQAPPSEPAPDLEPWTGKEDA